MRQLKTVMKKHFSLLVLFLCAIVSACDDDKHAELIFEEVSNTAPEHIQFFFASPDPACLPREATIYADQFGGKITIKSTNVAAFQLGHTANAGKNFHTDPVEGDDTDSNHYRCEKGLWSATLVNNNTLEIDFEIIDTDTEITPGSWFYLPVSATVDGETVNTSVAICRGFNYNFYEKPDVPDKEINTEDDIEYYELCPIDKYSIENSFIIGEDNTIFSRDNQTIGISYDACRIWLEVTMDKADPDFILFNSVPYMAIYSYVISPLNDKIRLVRNDSHGPMFKEVIPQDEFDYICNDLPAGDELHYSLILANIEKKALQKLNFTVKRK